MGAMPCTNAREWPYRRMPAVDEGTARTGSADQRERCGSGGRRDVLHGDVGPPQPLLLRLVRRRRRLPRARLARRLPRGERLDDVVHALGLEHDLGAIAARLVRELRAELVDVHVLGPFNRLAYPPSPP